MRGSAVSCYPTIVLSYYRTGAGEHEGCAASGYDEHHVVLADVVVEEGGLERHVERNIGAWWWGKGRGRG